MKRPSAEQIRTELNRRRLHEAEAMARSDAIMDARVGQAVNIQIAGRDRDRDDFETAIGALGHERPIGNAPGRSGSRSS